MEPTEDGAKSYLDRRGSARLGWAVAALDDNVGYRFKWENDGLVEGLLGSAHGC